MTASRRDNATGQGGEVGKANSNQRRNSTSPEPRPDISKAVADIRAAAATLARLAARDASRKGVQQ